MFYLSKFNNLLIKISISPYIDFHIFNIHYVFFVLLQPFSLAISLLGKFILVEFFNIPNTGVCQLVKHVWKKLASSIFMIFTKSIRCTLNIVKWQQLLEYFFNFIFGSQAPLIEVFEAGNETVDRRILI